MPILPTPWVKWIHSWNQMGSFIKVYVKILFNRVQFESFTEISTLIANNKEKEDGEAYGQ